MRFPTFSYERRLAAAGHKVIGVDEVGCGCLAGPVLAAAVHLPLNSRVRGVADSKLLKPLRREEIFAEIIMKEIPFSIGMASVAEIDKLNIRRASLLAMKRAVNGFIKNFGATFALIDAWKIPDLRIGQLGIIHGDRIVKSIAAASIIAKVVRDRLMCEFDKDFPGYGIAKHKGYGTDFHRRAILNIGPSTFHRKTFLKNLHIAS